MFVFMVKNQGNFDVVLSYYYYFFFRLDIKKESFRVESNIKRLNDIKSSSSTLKLYLIPPTLP